MEFPAIDKLQRGDFYVMPIKSDCMLYIPLPGCPAEKVKLVNKLEHYSAIQNGQEWFVECQLDPELK